MSDLVFNLVFAPSRQQFEYYMNSLGHSPYHREFKYVSDPRNVYGFEPKNVRVVIYNPDELPSDKRQLLQEAETRYGKGRIVAAGQHPSSA